MRNSAHQIIFTCNLTKFYPREFFSRGKFAKLNPREIKLCGKNREIKSHAKNSPYREFEKLTPREIYFFMFKENKMLPQVSPIVSPGST